MSETIAIIATGDMGHAVGRVLGEHGHRVITDLSGRSERSRQLADAGGIADLGSLDAVVTAADVFLSIAPPVAATGIATDVIAAMQRCALRIPFADCNAISPMTAMAMADDFEDFFVDMFKTLHDLSMADGFARNGFRGVIVICHNKVEILPIRQRVMDNMTARTGP